MNFEHKMSMFKQFPEWLERRWKMPQFQPPGCILPSFLLFDAKTGTIYGIPSKAGDTSMRICDLLPRK